MIILAVRRSGPGSILQLLNQDENEKQTNETIENNSKFNKLKAAAELLIKEFSQAVDDDDSQEIEEVDSIILNKFQNVEENIIKMMDKKHILENEYVKIEEKYKNELEVSLIRINIFNKGVEYKKS